MLLSILGNALWAGGFLGHVVLLGVLFGRRQAAKFPFFTALIAASVLRTICLFALRGRENAYLIAYVCASFLDSLLQVGVVYEVASNIFRPLGRWAPDTRRGMVRLICGSVALALVLTWLGAPPAPDRRDLVLVKADFLLAVLFSELFMGMVAISVTVGLPWKTQVSRIAYGLGAYSILDVAIEAGHTLYGPINNAAIDQVLTLIRQGSYLACLVYWIVTLRQELPETRELSEEMREQLSRLQSSLAYDLFTIRNRRKP